MKARSAFAVLASVSSVLGSCRCQPSAPTASAQGSASATAAAERSPREQGLLLAEHRRDSAAVSPEDLSSRDLRVRRAGARALARIADDRAAELLGPALADEDAEVVAWSAYGLGYTCVGRETATVHKLVARAASLFAAEPEGRPAPGATSFDGIDAISDALARCGTNEAERTLRVWLDGPGLRAHDSALALGRLAARHKRLDDASIVALLDAASRPDEPVSAALFAFSRLGGLPDSVQARLLQVASEAVARPEPARTFAVRALGRAGPRAIPKLTELATDNGFSPSDRAHAVRELAKLGPEGQTALGTVLAALLPEKKPLDQALLVSAAYGPLSSVLEGLTPGTASARPTLERLAKLTLPNNAGASLRRRLLTMRCSASALLATTSADARLLACDVDPKGRTGRLAVIRVLDRGRINGPRYARWKALVDSGDPRVRQAAIGLMPAHPEIAAPHQVLAAALAAKEDGTVAAAAEVIRAYPDRASEARAEQRREGRGTEQGADAKEPLPIKPDPGVVSALTRALESARAPDAVETRAALIDAAAALELLNLKRHVQTDCASDNPTLRQRAEKALRLFGERGRSCNKFAPPARGPAELDAPLTRKTTLRFTTDAGEHQMTLDPERAPVAVTRIVELARAGFFDGNVVHRVVPGFVVQFGDPGGDGYGGAGRQPLRCETSPLAFTDRSVGVALGGRDTGSSQIFVTLGRFPHLDGDYTLLGTADPSWEMLTEGDVIRDVKLLP